MGSTKELASIRQDMGKWSLRRPNRHRLQESAVVVQVVGLLDIGVVNDYGDGAARSERPTSSSTGILRILDDLASVREVSRRRTTNLLGRHCTCQRTTARTTNPMIAAMCGQQRLHERE